MHTNRGYGEGVATKIDEEVKNLIELRNQARKEKNWAEADRIRDELKAKGITIKDTPKGTIVVTE